ncbi:hypothetical protein ACHAC9_23300 [Massilia sp. CMS3.1]|uniref:hypothetical protein n=1 Tax=Massilia sp. CMS3.1 TaxID=3373083 RepID=UPI003EE68381
MNDRMQLPTASAPHSAPTTHLPIAQTSTCESAGNKHQVENASVDESLNGPPRATTRDVSYLAKTGDSLTRLAADMLAAAGPVSNKGPLVEAACLRQWAHRILALEAAPATTGLTAQDPCPGCGKALLGTQEIIKPDSSKVVQMRCAGCRWQGRERPVSVAPDKAIERLANVWSGNNADGQDTVIERHNARLAVLTAAPLKPYEQATSRRLMRCARLQPALPANGTARRLSNLVSFPTIRRPMFFGLSGQQAARFRRRLSFDSAAHVHRSLVPGPLASRNQ